MAGASWATAIRLARRNARRSLGRTILVAVLIGLPMAGAAGLGVVVASKNPSADVRVELELGSADARLRVTEFDHLIREETVYGPAYVPPPGVDPNRKPADVDLRKLLPTGTAFTRAPEYLTTTRIRVGDTVGSYSVTVSGSGPLLDGTYRRNEGRLPATADEVAVTPALAKHLGLLTDGKLIPGATMIAEDGHRYAVVGQVQPQSGPNSPSIWASADSRLAADSGFILNSHLAKFPASLDLVAIQSGLAAKGIEMLTRADLAQWGNHGADIGTMASSALIVGFGVLEIVLLAGTAFAVGARRQSRELGLVTANGGRPKDIRRMVLAQGLVIGLGGSVAGTVLGIGIALSGRPWWERLTGQLFTAWQIPWAGIAGMILVGVLAGLASAVVPAIHAGRQTPLAALAGRFEVSTGRARLPRPALALIAIGVVANLTGTSLLAKALAAAVARVDADRATGAPVNYGTEQPFGPLALIIAGAAAVLIGVIWLLPNLVAKAAGLGRWLPLGGRLALRDAARQRHRTGPTAAAIMMAVAVTAALAFGFANDFATKDAEYVAAGREGDAVLSYRGDDSANDGIAYDDPKAVYSAALRDQVADALPTKAAFDIGNATRGTASDGESSTLAVFSPPSTQSDQLSLVVVDPAYVESLGGYGPATAEALRKGHVVVTKPAMIAKGKVRIDPYGAAPTKHTRYLPAEAIPFVPTASSIRARAIVSPEVAATLGKTQVMQTHYQLTREPTEEELAAVTTLTKSEKSIYVEKGYQRPDALAMAGVLGMATVVTLLGVAVAVSLSAAEGRADLATLAAVGAQPRRRRNLAAAQAWLLGQIGCLLGVGVGTLFGYTTRPITRSPYFAVPWLQLLGIVVLVPLFAAGLAWLMTRSRLPMLRRAE